MIEGMVFRASLWGQDENVDLRRCVIGKIRIKITRKPRVFDLQSASRRLGELVWQGADD